MAKQIKAKQREMYNLAKAKGVNDPDVYDKSCEIDDMIVEYMKKYANVNSGTLFPNYKFEGKGRNSKIFVE